MGLKCSKKSKSLLLESKRVDIIILFLICAQRLRGEKQLKQQQPNQQQYHLPCWYKLPAMLHTCWFFFRWKLWFNKVYILTDTTMVWKRAKHTRFYVSNIKKKKKNMVDISTNRSTLAQIQVGSETPI